MALFDIPWVQKASISLAVAGVTATAGGLIATRDKVEAHTLQIAELQATREDVRDIKKDIALIREAVARIDERTRKE